MTSKLIVFLVCIAAVIGSLLIWLLNIRKARTENVRIFQNIAKTYVYSTNLDSMIASRSIDITGPSDIDSGLWKLATLARWIAVKAVNRAESKGLNDDDRFVAMLFALAAADCLSSGTNFPMEAVGTVACISLNAELFGSANSDGIDEAVRAFNKMVLNGQHSKTLQAIGNQIALLVVSNDDAQLIALSGLFGAMRDHVRFAE